MKYNKKNYRDTIRDRVGICDTFADLGQNFIESMMTHYMVLGTPGNYVVYRES